MLIRSRTEIIPASNAVLDIGRLSEYRRLRNRIPIERQKYFATHKQVLHIANFYFDKSELRETVVSLRREIRRVTRGTPVTSAQDAIVDAGYIPNGTEQLYNAQSALLRAAYKLVRKLVHPDSSKYDGELFQQIKAAYALRDLTFLQETYIALVHEKDLFWCVSEGIEYALQEIRRPQVSLQILRATPEFAVAQKHLTGRGLEARMLAEKRMASLVVTLNAELAHIINPRGEKDVEEKEGSGSPHSRKESKTRAEGCCDADTAGESTTCAQVRRDSSSEEKSFADVQGPE